nr:hypothetical protein [Tanacetum cinerariifolium]
MADNLSKIVWYSTHHVALIKSWLVQKKTALGVSTPRSDEDRLKLMELTVFVLPSDEKGEFKFWTTVTVKKVNDVTRLQALVDKKNVVVMEATIRDAFRLDDAKGVECLPNKEIFAELASMGYEKPSTKLTFYKAFFSSQLNSLNHTILQCRKFNFSKYIFDSLVMNVDSPTKFYMYPRFLQLMIRKQVGDLSTHITKYASLALTQKVFANMRRLGKGFSRVETSLFEGMLVAQEIEEGDADENVEDVHAGDATEGDVSAANDEVTTADEKPSIPSPTPTTPPPQPSQDVPSTSQKVGTAQRIDTYDDNVMDDVSNQGRMIAGMDLDDDVVLEEAKDVAEDAKDDQDVDVQVNADIQGRTAESQTEIYKIDLDHNVVNTAKIITEVVTAASETINAASTNITTVDAQVPAATTAAALKLTAAPRRRTKGVVITDPKESTTTSKIIHSEAKSKDKGKEILVEEPKPLKKKPRTEAQARKNMMVYLKNIAGFKMDCFKGMSYDNIRPVFEKHFNSNMAFFQKTKEHIDKEESRALKRINETPAKKTAKRQKLDEEVGELKRHLQIVPNEDDDVYTEATPLARKVPVVDYKIYNENNKPYFKIIRADGTHQLYVSFLSSLRNFDIEDLEALWSLVKERFDTAKPKNFSDDFLLMKLRAMFEKPDIHAQIWKNQRKRKYPLTKFTLNQMLNNVRLKVEEESEVSLELLSFGVDVAEEFEENMLSV